MLHYYPLGVLTVSWLFWLWDSYLAYRQYRVYTTTEKVPKVLEKKMTKETFLKSKAYSIDKASFGFIAGLIDQIQSTLVICYYIMPFFWNFSGDFMTQGLGLTRSNSIEWEIFQSLMFTLITTIASTIINLPISIYGTFVIEQRHGFNKQTAGFYAWDKFKGFLVTYLISAPVIAATIYIVRNGGPYFFLYLWTFCSIFICIIMFFSGEIAAIFDKFTPLSDGELKDRIEKMASSVGFPLSNIFVVEGSKRSAHSNAYQSGFFNKKLIVIYDTLIQGYEGEKDDEKQSEQKDDSKKKKTSAGCNTGEIIGVLCHELGHWYCSHLYKNLALVEVHLFTMFLIFSKFYNDPAFYAAFGFVDENPIIIGLALLSMILTPYNELKGYVSTALTRRFEYEADRFAKDRGYGKELSTALVKINVDNLGFPVHDELYSKFNHSHPTLLQRLKEIAKTD